MIVRYSSMHVCSRDMHTINLNDYVINYLNFITILVFIILYYCIIYNCFKSFEIVNWLPTNIAMHQVYWSSACHFYRKKILESICTYASSSALL